MYYNAPDTDSLAKYEGQPPIYSDLGGDEFLARATHLLSDKNIVTGFNDGTFRPNATLTRAEAAMMLRPLVKGDYASKNFPDTEKHWARDAIGYLAGAKVINGFEDGTFRPDDDLTYSQAIQLVYSIMGMNCDFYWLRLLQGRRQLHRQRQDLTRQLRENTRERVRHKSYSR